MMLKASLFCLLLTACAVCGTSSPAAAAPQPGSALAPPTADEPPLPPPAPAPPPGSLPPPPPVPQTPELRAISRYQDCIQRMIDQSLSDNQFMRHCLGLPPKAAPLKPSVESELAKRLLPEVQNELPQIKACYDKMLVRSKALGLLPEGQVEARAPLDDSGKLGEVTFAPSSMTDLELLGCIRTVMQGWHLSQPAPVHRPVVTFAFRLAMSSHTAKDQGHAQATLVPGFPRVPEEQGRVALSPQSQQLYGTMPQDVASAVFQRHAAGLRYCYEQVLRRRPGVTGKVLAELGVGADGAVASVSYREFSLPDDGFRNCLTNQFHTWRYPKSGKGEAQTVRYPTLLFSPETASGSGKNTSVNRSR